MLKVLSSMEIPSDGKNQGTKKEEIKIFSCHHLIFLEQNEPEICHTIMQTDRETDSQSDNLTLHMIIFKRIFFKINKNPTVFSSHLSLSPPDFLNTNYNRMKIKYM